MVLRDLCCLQIHNDYQIDGGETKTAERIGNLLESVGIKVIRYYKTNMIFKNSNSFEKLLIGVNSLNNRKTIVDIEKIIKEHHIDFALIHNVMPIISNSVYKVLSNYNIPIIKYVQNYNLVCLNGAIDHGDSCSKCKKNGVVGLCNCCYKDNFFYTLIKYIVKKQLDLKYIPSISAFMSNSNFVMNRHNEFGMNTGKFYVMYNFIDSESVDFSPANYHSYYLYFGRISKEKGVFSLISAFKSLAGINLVIMGNGEKELSLISSIKGMNNVKYIGGKHGDDMLSVLKQAKTVIVSSEWDEPLPRTILEAYSFGIPVIGSNRGGITEMVSSETGTVYKSGDIYDLCLAIKRIESLPIEQYTKMRRNCLDVCKTKYSRTGYIRRFFNVLEKIGVIS